MRISYWSSDVCSSDLIDHLPHRFRHRLALLGGHKRGEILLVLHHQVGPFADDLRALLRGARTPFGPGAVRRLDGAAGLLRAHFWHGADRQLGRASGWERVCQYGSISVGAVYLK